LVVVLLAIASPDRGASVTPDREQLNIEVGREEQVTATITPPRPHVPLTMQEREVYFQALVRHHVQILPNNINRDRNLNCLALNIFHESRGEPLLGQLAVANVTMNRQQVNPDLSICSIVYSPNQFEWTAKRLREPSGDAWRQASTIAWLVIHFPDLVFDVTDNARYFHSARRSPRSFRKFEHTVTIGNHRFYRERFVEVAQALN